MSDVFARVWELVLEQNPRHRQFLDGALAALSPEEAAELTEYLRFLEAQGHAAAFVAECYNTIVMDTLREQIWFRRHARYRHATFADVASDVYHNPEYMRRYMIGLALSSFVWPNHAAMRRHFVSTLPADTGGGYLEVGPGHGFYFTHAIRRGGFDRYVGVDISETSCALTRAVVDHFCPDAGVPVDVLCRDFLVGELDAGPFGAIVMGEVLEHVEAPDAFLARLAALADPTTHIHVTTCINAPAVDHIFLYRSVQEIEAQITAAGLTVRDRCLMPHVGKTLAECEAEALPVNVAFSLATT